MKSASAAPALLVKCFSFSGSPGGPASPSGSRSPATAPLASITPTISKPSSVRALGSAFSTRFPTAGFPNADGLFIGGGFPETQAAALEANAELRADIARKIRAGLPTYAECGGMMYLARSIQWKGVSHQDGGHHPSRSCHALTGPKGGGLFSCRKPKSCPGPP